MGFECFKRDVKTRSMETVGKKTGWRIDRSCINAGQQWTLRMHGWWIHHHTQHAGLTAGWEWITGIMTHKEEDMQGCIAGGRNNLILLIPTPMHAWIPHTWRIQSDMSNTIRGHPGPSGASFTISVAQIEGWARGFSPEWV